MKQIPYNYWPLLWWSIGISLGLLLLIFLFYILREKSARSAGGKTLGWGIGLFVINIVIGNFGSGCSTLKYDPVVTHNILVDYMAMFKDIPGSMPDSIKVRNSKRQQAIYDLMQSKKILKETQDTVFILCELHTRLECSILEDVRTWSSIDTDYYDFAFSPRTQKIADSIIKLRERECVDSTLIPIVRTMHDTAVWVQVRFNKAFYDFEHNNRMIDKLHLSNDYFIEIFENSFHRKFKSDFSRKK